MVVSAGSTTVTGTDELIVVCDVFDTALRLRSLDIAAQAVELVDQVH